MKKKKLVILLSCIAGGVVILGIAIALLLSPITSFLHSGTGDAFKNVGTCAGRRESQATPNATDMFITPEPIATPRADATPSNPEHETPQPTEVATPEPTVDPYQVLYEKADTSMMKDIVNILLVGVDYAPERETWNGKKEWHSDAMIVLAVNFEDNRADLISLPRDTYAQIPDIKGIYKLNAALNCGGGLYNEDGTFNPKGLEKVCEAAEWMIGGIEIDYYYAVTMTSLKDLVDLCGGLDYDMDIKFHIQGRSYEKGMQHIDGQGFLDYCRVRKASNGLTAAETEDSRRVDRQKRILIALFRQMQADQLITKIPDIVDTFDGDLFTNCTYGQTAALAAFAYNLSPDNIGMYSMLGSMHSLFQWRFCFTDQKNRVEVIKQIYGVDVKKYTQYTVNYGRYRWCDMLYTHYQDLLTPLTKYVQKLIDEDDMLPEFTSEPTPDTTPSPSPTATQNTDKPTDTPTSAPTAPLTLPPTAEPPTPEPTTPEPPTPEPPTPQPTDPDEGGEGRARLYANATTEQTRKYTKEQRELFEQYKTCVKELEKLHKDADKEAKKARKGKSNSLGSVGQEYLKKLDEVQTLAIEVAKTFDYTKVKNFTTPFGATSSGYSSSPWAVNFFRDKKFNEVIVDFN